MKALRVVLMGIASLPVVADPSFLFPTTIRLQGKVLTIVAGDFNSDGFGDFAVSYQTGTGQASVAVFLGSSDGHLTRKNLPAINPDGNDIVRAVADLNHDGKLDLITGYGVALGNGDGTFQRLSPFQKSPTASLRALGLATPITNAPNFIEVADFNGDGIPDLCFGGFHALSVSLGVGDGSFRPAISTPPLFPNENPAAPDTLAVFTVGDFDGDGRADIVYSDVGGSASILFGNGDGTFTRRSFGPNVGAYPGALITGDLNGDGVVDLVSTAEQTGQVWSILGHGKGSFSPTFLYPASSGYNGPLAMADFDGDKRQDIANYFAIYPGNGDGTLRSPSSFAWMPGLASNTSWMYGGPYEPPPVVVADVNGDGRPDLVGVGPGLDTITVLINATGTPVASAPAFLAATGIRFLAPGAVATLYGMDLADITAAAGFPFPATLGNASVEIVDFSGTTFQAPLLYVSPTQINFQVPEGVAPVGPAVINVLGRGRVRGAHSTVVLLVAAGIFTLDGSLDGAPLASAVRVAIDGTRNPVNTSEPIVIDGSSQVYLSLYGTGFRHSDFAGCGLSSATIRYLPVTATYIGPQSATSPIDQVNILLPTNSPKGSVTLGCSFGVLSYQGDALAPEIYGNANLVTITIQ